MFYYWFTYGFAAFVAIFHFLASVIQILYFTLKRLKRPRFALEMLNFRGVHIFFGQNCCTAHNLALNTNSNINSTSNTNSNNNSTPNTNSTINQILNNSNINEFKHKLIQTSTQFTKFGKLFCKE